jgi:CRISPR/Cas system-associated protein Cas10 (large subunit of type III CRISPR-Cas system)
MGDQGARTKQDDFDDGIRPALTIALLERSDKSGETMRALLFIAAAGAFAFILQQQSGETIGHHIWPLVLFGLTAALAFCSWDYQKKKAGEKFEKLRDHGMDAYRKTTGFPNYWIDRLAGIIFAIGVGIETGIRLCETG